MFKSGKDNMRMEPTPERVFALGRFMLSGVYSREEIYQKICMVDVFGEGSKDIFGYTLSVAQELEIIKDVEGKYQLSIDPTILESPNTFRRYAARTAFARINSLFFKTSSLYLKIAEDVLKCQNWSAVTNLFNQNDVSVSENDILGWRFWVSYFGLGYLHRNMLIPNTCNRIKDVLVQQDELKCNQPISVMEFFNWLEVQCPELKESRMDSRIGMGVSNGLRTLHFQKEIQLISQPDALKWQLYGLESEDINDISHVRIMR
ncbi:hypothetical protein [Brevibacillus dissolubilis]|uniref:hypothetical protein n=1 Tax=Brevibacillus dissolubilis TaxID=1844116 RepID=UPI0011175ABD|nr:hypothetical protein [Brevibacillus dissolubilis]